MDPLSITAGIIALIGAANQVAVGLNKLASMREAPDAVRALNNEVSDLRLVLDDAEPLLRKHERMSRPNAPGDSKFLLGLEHGKERLAELETLIQNRLFTRMGKIDRFGWLFEQNKVQRALVDIRAVRLSIVARLALVNASTTYRIETKVEDVHIANEQGQVARFQSLASQSDVLQQAVAQVITAQKLHSERLDCLEASLSHKEKNSASKSEQEAIPGSAFRADSFSALRMRFLRKGKCGRWCDCDCHTYRRTRSPQQLQSFLGALFVGYTGLPALTPDCTNEKCRRSSEAFVQINYYFPTWFALSVSAAVSFQNSIIPEISRRVLNVRDSYEEIFQSAIIGDAVSVQYLLTKRQASVFDISSDSGHSPLHCAVKGSHVEVIKVLLQMGAEPYLENEQQETPYDMASDNIFYFEGTPNAAAYHIDEIRTLFPTLESVEERRRFTRIHKIVLKILHLDLEKELRQDRSKIDQSDADGRTPLSWAAARGDSESVEILLRLGASPDTPDRIGQGPLRQSMKAHTGCCAKLLLAYGAKVDQRDDWQQTCLLSSMYSANPMPFSVALLKAGAQVNVRCGQGRSPFMEAVVKNQIEAVKLLLRHGADVNSANNAGATPLHEGIRYNSHEALSLLLDTAVDHTLRDVAGRTVLHWAAEYADLKTLAILQQERLHGLSADDRCKEGMNAIDVAEKRRDEEMARGQEFLVVDSEWLTAFTGVMESLMAFTTPRSVLSYTGSMASEDAFMDALDLAEGNCVPYTEVQPSESGI